MGLGGLVLGSLTLLPYGPWGEGSFTVLASAAAVRW